MRRGARALPALGLLLAGCAASAGLTRSRATVPGMPCAEADRVARAALLRVGYDGEVITPSQPGIPGQVVAHKAGGYDYVTNAATRQYTATVTVTCSNAGATLDAVTDEPLPGSLTFKGDFAGSVTAVAARRIQRPRLAGRPETGVVIAIEPLRSGEARDALGIDLPAVGVTPVRLTIENRTDRAYVFAAARVRLQTQEGARVAPLSSAELGRIAGPDARRAAGEHALADARVAPHAVIKGFLYVPASAYRRATVVLVDQETDEDEGFSVEF